MFAVLLFTPANNTSPITTSPSIIAFFMGLSLCKKVGSLLFPGLEIEPPAVEFELITYPPPILARRNGLDFTLAKTVVLLEFEDVLAVCFGANCPDL
jgi:hypothetical protein